VPVLLAYFEGAECMCACWQERGKHKKNITDKVKKGGK
jgi:hypothetical protein